jgi:hypothetical protein
MNESELPKLIEQGRSLVQDVALLIANESEERALDVLTSCAVACSKRA